jgi:hypothetical protein
MVDFLIGLPDCEDVRFYSEGEIGKRLIFRSGYYSDMDKWLNLKYQQNSYRLCLYLVEHRYQCLSDEKILAIQSEIDGLKRRFAR